MRMLIVNPIAGCGYALKVMEQVQSVLTARPRAAPVRRD